MRGDGLLPLYRRGIEHLHGRTDEPCRGRMKARIFEKSVTRAFVTHMWIDAPSGMRCVSIER